MGIPALTDDERRDLTDPRAEFTAEERVVVAMTYLLSGENAALAANRASKALQHEVPAGTLRQWRRREWWVVAETAAKRRLQTELENGYTRLLHITEEKMLDRIENGDSRINPLAGKPRLVKAKDEDGEAVYDIHPDILLVPVTLRDLVGAHAIVSDKRAMIRGEPTSRREDAGLDLALKLAAAFHKMGQVALQGASIPGEFEVVEPHPDVVRLPSTVTE